MVSETPATARLSHVGHRRAPTLSNQIAGKDRQTCRGLGGSGLLLPASWEVTGIRTCWRRGGGSSSRARHTYLHSLVAHAAPRATPPAETRPGSAGAAAVASQRRRALEHRAAKFRPRSSQRRLAPRPPSAAAAQRALAPRSPRAGFGGGCPRLVCAGRCRAQWGAGQEGASGLRGPGRQRRRCLLRAVIRGLRRVLQRRCPSPLPDVLILLQQILQPAPRLPSQDVNFFQPGLACRRGGCWRPYLGEKERRRAAVVALGTEGRRFRAACPWLVGLVSVLRPQPSLEQLCASSRASVVCVPGEGTKSRAREGGG